MENAWPSPALGHLGSDSSQKAVFVGLSQPFTAWPGSWRPGALRSARWRKCPRQLDSPGVGQRRSQQEQPAEAHSRGAEAALLGCFWVPPSQVDMPGE